MSNHPQADAPGNVKLWRCDHTAECQTTGCPHYKHANQEGEYVFKCREPHYCSRAKTNVSCQPCGFRTPPTCWDCEHWERHFYSRPCGPCFGTFERPNYTPRRPGKGGAA